MAHVDADVMIIDEVLAVGDAAFQQKCYDEFNRIRDEGKTVLFVTHDMGAVERYCDRALLLEKGEIVAIGEPHEVGQEYLRLNFADQAPDLGHDEPDDPAVDEDPLRAGDGRAEIVEAWFEDAGGAPAAAAPHGETCTFAARVKVNEALEDPLFGVVLQNDRGETVLAASSHWVRERTGSFAAGDELTFRIRFENVFSPGRYRATPAVAHRGAGIQWIDRREDFVSVVVTATQTTDAAVIIPYDLEIS
jgi:hypothetical protein